MQIIFLWQFLLSKRPLFFLVFSNIVRIDNIRLYSLSLDPIFLEEIGTPPLSLNSIPFARMKRRRCVQSPDASVSGQFRLIPRRNEAELLRIPSERAHVRSRTSAIIASPPPRWRIEHREIMSAERTRINAPFARHLDLLCIILPA